LVPYILHFEPSLDALSLRSDVISSINRSLSLGGGSSFGLRVEGQKHPVEGESVILVPAETLVSLSVRLTDLLGPVTRVKKKQKKKYLVGGESVLLVPAEATFFFTLVTGPRRSLSL